MDDGSELSSIVGVSSVCFCILAKFCPGCYLFRAVEGRVRILCIQELDHVTGGAKCIKMM